MGERETIRNDGKGKLIKSGNMLNLSYSQEE